VNAVLLARILQEGKTRSLAGCDKKTEQDLSTSSIAEAGAVYVGNDGNASDTKPSCRAIQCSQEIGGGGKNALDYSQEVGEHAGSSSRRSVGN